MKLRLEIRARSGQGARDGRHGRLLLAAGMLAVAFAGLVLSGCAGTLPRPLIERSPLRSPVTLTFFPVVALPAARLGMAGCPGRPASAEAFGLSWCYSWSPDPGTHLPGVEQVPMIWDETHLEDQVGGSSQWVLGFNEPDWPSQAAMTPQQAVDAWQVLEARFPDRRLAGPVVTQFGLTWWTEWLAEFERHTGRRPRLDALAVHANLPSSEAIPWVTWWILEARRLGVREVWVTELHQWSEADAQAFVAWLDVQPAVTRYAPYVSRQACGDWTWDCERFGDPSLLDADGSLTERGRWYAQPAEW